MAAIARSSTATPTPARPSSTSTCTCSAAGSSHGRRGSPRQQILAAALAPIQIEIDGAIAAPEVRRELLARRDPPGLREIERVLLHRREVAWHRHQHPRCVQIVPDIGGTLPVAVEAGVDCRRRVEYVP